MADKKNISTLKTILYKAQKYCAYQERCIQEVTAKLREWKTNEENIPKIVTKLIDEKFIDEHRYAELFAKGKFQQKKWGRKKICYELHRKNIPEDIINNALQQIDEDEYLKTIVALATAKSKEIKEKDVFKKKQKIIRYLLSKGYEIDIVTDIIKNENII